MVSKEKMLTLKDVGILTGKSEGFIKSKIAKGLLIKYDKLGKPLVDPIKHKGFFKLVDIKKVFDMEPDLNKLTEPSCNQNTKYEEIDISPQKIIRVAQPNLYKKLEDINNMRFNVCIAAFDITPEELLLPFRFEDNSEALQRIRESCQAIEKMSGLLTDNGSLLIYDAPKWLPYYAVHLANELVFKYWIANRTFDIRGSGIFDPVAMGMLLMVKKNENFVINTIREPHKKCRYCKELLKDYGGKKHLMHQKGAALSDVWKFMDTGSQDVNKIHTMPKAVLKRATNLLCRDDSHLLLVKVNGSNELL